MKYVILALLILGVIILSGIIFNEIKDSVKKRRILEKELHAEQEKNKKFEEETLSLLDKIKKQVYANNKDNDVLYKRCKEYIKETYSVLQESSELAIKLYEEHKILIQYAHICHDIYQEPDVPEDIYQRIKETMDMHDAFLAENDYPNEATPQDISHIETSQPGFDINMEWQ